MRFFKKYSYPGILVFWFLSFLVVDIQAQESLVDVRDRINANNRLDVAVSLTWADPKVFNFSDGRSITRPFFENAAQTPDQNLPIYSAIFFLGKGYIGAEAELTNTYSAILSDAEKVALKAAKLPEEYKVLTHIGNSIEGSYLYVSVEPIKRINNTLEKLLSFNLNFSLKRGQANKTGRDLNVWSENSVLSSGNWYKFATAADAVYKLSYAQLEEFGILEEEIPSNQIRIYGTPAGELEVDNSKEYFDDLIEFSIWINDGDDGVFNSGDYLLFYGEDQDTWVESGLDFSHQRNPYADSNFYFLTIDGGTGVPKRIVESDIQSYNHVSNAYDFLEFHEDDLFNLIKSGRQWYGEQLGTVPYFDFGFSVPNAISTEKAYISATYAARSVAINGVKVKMSLLNQNVSEKYNVISPVSSGYATTYAVRGSLRADFFPSNSNFNTRISIDNSANPQALAWIDELEILARRELVYMPPFMPIRDLKSVGQDRVTRFELKTESDQIFVWDITNQFEIKQLKLNSIAAGQYWFTAKTDTLKEIVVCSKGEYQSPTFRGKVANQNLHSLRNLDYVIVTHPKFKSQANQLAELHKNTDGLTAQVVDVYQIYNEFSGGVQDITAIKQLMRMLYKRALNEGGNTPKYLLLFGDASYDYKNRISGNSNFVPSYQTVNSLTPTASIVSDDYFGLLDDSEGEAANDLVDIGIGRLPARSSSEATSMLNKILAYASSSSFGEWRNWLAFVSDDSESTGNPHVFMEDCDQLDAIVSDSASNINVQKLYMDAFVQVAGSGGQRYPDGAAAISERVEKGALLMYYVGHGGELGWAHERILEVATINKWSNSPKLPVFVTATCEFTRYDDPRRTSAGEFVLLNPNGGGIALLTTTRAVYGSPNLTLTTQFTKAAFSSIAAGKQRLGDLTRLTKVRSLTINDTTTAGETSLIATNTRCFTLLGDPALKLAYPEFRVEITAMPDTLRALEKVVVKGKVVDNSGQMLSDFNGIVIPVIFDKISTLRTLDNDLETAYDFEERRNIIFRGKVRAKDGLFQFEFIVPKDIEKSYGNGKVSLYAFDQNRDATGSFFNFIIGGISDNPINDKTGPEVSLYLNNAKFVFGGLTDENPDLYAELFDESGINMVGSGVGHDIIAVLDGNSSNTLVLNDYYEADIDSYQSGKVRYPFNKLSEGLHTLRFQAWDVNNNPSEEYTEFVVANSADIALSHILNYPNPFTTNTAFYFEHNKPGQFLNIEVEIFTVSGRLIKTIRTYSTSDGFGVGPIAWDGLDDFGDSIGKGVYLYKLKVTTPQGQTAEQFERLVILN